MRKVVVRAALFIVCKGYPCLPVTLPVLTNLLGAKGMDVSAYVN